MEFIHGIKITDKQTILKHGFDPAEILTKMMKILGEQVFVHGYKIFNVNKKMKGRERQRVNIIRCTFVFVIESRTMFVSPDSSMLIPTLAIFL